MKAGNVRVATFENASIEDLMNDINSFMSGDAVTGPPAFAADFIKEAEFIDIQFRSDGATYSAMIVYVK